MSQMTRWFQEGGFAMFPILLLGVVGLVGTIAGLAIGLSSRRRGTPLAFGAGLLAVAVLCVGIGGASYLMAEMKIDAALVAVAPEMRDELRTVGRAEARVALTFGGGAAALPAIGGLLLVALGLARGRDPAAGA
ncbi:MAG: hypothetical protein HY906_04215 [Deltaproteobacteria bacterium]|nr:hypothetical protein [Deltaproteobacteria bacterium]